ncbi:MAG: hypothetical protein Q9157_007602 [Trypethelium eluteriae]
MAPTIASEGLIDFKPKGVDKPCSTWYRIVGSLDSPNPPLILLHGGPSACHEYMLSFVDLQKLHNIPVILYDMLGNGKSTRVPEKNGDESFWTITLFMDELENLIMHLKLREQGTKHFDILGHSFGGMMAAEYAASHPAGLRKLILAAAPASAELHKEGLLSLKATLPGDVQNTIDRCERDGQTDSKEYEGAMHPKIPATDFFIILKFFSLSTIHSLRPSRWGSSELDIKGSLRNWSSIPGLSSIKFETFIINAQYDEVQDIAVKPFFERIEKVKWVTLENASHMAHWEKRERYRKLATTWGLLLRKHLVPPAARQLANTHLVYPKYLPKPATYGLHLPPGKAPLGLQCGHKLKQAPQEMRQSTSTPPTLPSPNLSAPSAPSSQTRSSLPPPPSPPLIQPILRRRPSRTFPIRRSCSQIRRLRSSDDARSWLQKRKRSFSGEGRVGRAGGSWMR